MLYMMCMYTLALSRSLGFNPVWNTTIQQVVTFPELCLIRFKVLDYDRLSQDDFIGQYTLPFESMESGTVSNPLLIFYHFLIY